MTTAEALAQIRDALRAKYWLLQRPEDVEQAFAEALATLDFLEAEIERLQARIRRRDARQASSPATGALFELALKHRKR